MKRVTRYEVAAFITGFSLLAYELTAARILAPNIGSSMYVWTSVIGVIIAALSVGYAVGGVWADKRVKASDIAGLLLLAAGGVVVTLAMADIVLGVVQGTIPDPRIQGLVVSVVLFAPTSFVMGAISPYLARLRTVSLETTGTSVAMLSAANALGGIIGTFSVGFIFFGYVGSRETLWCVSALLACTSPFFTPLRERLGRMVTGLFALALAMVIFPQVHARGEVADIDTPSARYKIYDTTYNSQPVRMLATGPGTAQSGMYIRAPKDLTFFYTRQMAALVAKAPKKDRILVLGGGALTLPRALAEAHPASRIDVVEIDPRLKGIARQYFHYQDHPNIQIIVQDARAFLNIDKTQYDLILVDVYDDSTTPFSTTTREYAQKLKASVRPGGMVLANVIGADTPACRPLLRAVHASYMSVFASYRVYPQEDRTLMNRQSLIFAYADNLPHDHAGITPDLGGGMSLTDNYAPVERLKLRC